MFLHLSIRSQAEPLDSPSNPDFQASQPPYYPTYANDYDSDEPSDPFLPSTTSHHELLNVNGLHKVSTFPSVSPTPTIHRAAQNRLLTFLLLTIALAILLLAHLSSFGFLVVPSLSLLSGELLPPQVAIGNAPSTYEWSSDQTDRLPESHLFDGDGTVNGSWDHENNHQIQALRACLKTKSCSPNQEIVIIVVGPYFENNPRYVGGEVVWARSTLIAIKNAGYTYLYAFDINRLLEQYTFFPDRVKAIIADDASFSVCLSMSSPFSSIEDRDNDDVKPGCLKTSQSSDDTSIPVWKMFNFHFWSDRGRHPLDGRWVLSPESYFAFQEMRTSSSNLHANKTTRRPAPSSPAVRTGSNQYLGYSVERSCLSVPYVPASSRHIAGTKKTSRQAQAYILSKRLSYFVPGAQDAAWPLSFYDAAQASLGVDFIGGFIDDHQDLSKVAEFDTWKMERLAELETDLERVGDGGGDSEQDVKDMELRLKLEEELARVESIKIIGLKDLPKSITNLGLTTPRVFVGRVAESSVLVGVGSPLLSPTPYEALCLGVPFINPIVQWNVSEPEDRSQWKTQHEGLQHLDPPYVYHVHKDDEKGFMDAIRQALKNPIDRYILPDMTFEAIQERLENIVSVDWRVEAEQLLKERQQSEHGQLFAL